MRAVVAVVALLASCAAATELSWRLPSNYDVQCTVDESAARPSAWDPALVAPGPSAGLELTLRNVFVIESPPGSDNVLTQFEWQVRNDAAPNNAVQILDGGLATCNSSAPGAPLFFLLRGDNGTLAFFDETTDIADGVPPAGARSTACDGQSNPSGFWQNVSSVAQYALPPRFYWYYQNATETVPEGQLLLLVNATDALVCEQLEPGNFAVTFSVQMPTPCRGVYNPEQFSYTIAVNGTAVSAISPPMDYNFTTNTFTFTFFDDDNALLVYPFRLTVDVVASVFSPPRLLATQIFDVGANCTFLGPADLSPSPGSTEEIAAVTGSVFGFVCFLACCLCACACARQTLRAKSG